MTADPRLPWSVRFRREREKSWTELEELVRRAEKSGLSALTPDQLRRLPVLYRAVLSSLEVARASVADRSLLDWLQSLAARAYLVVHAPRRSLAEVVWQFLAWGFPATVRAIRWHLLLSAALLLLGMAIAWVLVAADPDRHYWLFMPAEMAQGRSPEATTAELREPLFSGAQEDRALLTFAVYLFTHNSSIGILTYGLGFALGLPVALLLFYNGMILGAMSALYHSRGLAVEWWSWVLPHGGTEILAIVLCGAAGLAIGERLLFPGTGSRLHELAVAGRRLGAVIAGAIAMLALAGIIEGVFRQLVDSVFVRYALATLLAGSWVVYFTLAGRRR
ncbi:MAG: stage II sporulation protein M [Planctomycetes bacterium]|nr:stage II sporulation protein M [Planctomycetota bacterium]